MNDDRYLFERRLPPRYMRERRQDLGLTLEDLSQRTGLPVDVVDDIENGHLPEPQGPTQLLARALGHRIDELSNQPEERDDIARVGALLNHLGQATAAETLAHALEWTLSRTHAALDALDRRLRDLGQALRTETGHRYAITIDPTALGPIAKRRAREHQEAPRLDLTTAKVLDTALNGRRRDRACHELPADQRANLQRLIDLELIDDDGFTIAATWELRVDLGYERAPRNHMRGW